MNASDKGKIEEIVLALTAFGSEKMISYDKEIDWLMNLPNRFPGFTSVETELPEKIEGEEISDYVLATNGEWRLGTWYLVLRYDYRDKTWSEYNGQCHWGVKYWMPLPSYKDA